METKKIRGFEIVSEYLEKGVTLPARQTSMSAGYDLAAAKDVLIKKGETALVPTGVKAYFPPDEVLMIYIRSSLATKRNITLANSVGVIDADYYGNNENEGQIFLPLWNFGNSDILIKKGERVAQGIFQKYLVVDNDVALQAHRQGGFGSTG